VAGRNCKLLLKHIHRGIPSARRRGKIKKREKEKETVQYSEPDRALRRKGNRGPLFGGTESTRTAGKSENNTWEGETAPAERTVSKPAWGRKGG